MNAIQDLFKNEIRLPSPPAIVLRILQAVRRDGSSFGELSEIISSDPALTIRVLKVANSSFYALPYQVDSLKKALSLMGFNALKNIALSFVIVDGLRGDNAAGFDLDFFWRRAITAAVGAELLAPIVRHATDDAFVTALLQDIGIIVLNSCRAADYSRVLAERQTSRKPVVTIEKEILGYDHQEVGAEVLKRWGLPETISGPIRYHHANGDTPAAYRTSSGILFVSDRVASGYYGRDRKRRLAMAGQALRSRFDVDEDTTEGYIGAVADKSLEVLTSFDLDPGRLIPYSQILQEANEELNKLNLTYEQLVTELTHAKERAERLADELTTANARLQALVSRDGLTGLFNHQHFQEVMDRELSGAKRYKRHLSLIMFDIDRFKVVNDTYGHQCGDVILKSISAVVRKLIRACDTAARYGGEEFSLILPETAPQGALILAERLRHAVECLETTASGHRIGVTISLGVATYAPGTGACRKATLIDAADKALYRSKADGRNRVCFGECQA